MDLVAGANINTVTGSGNYKYGQTVNISATLKEENGYTIAFDKWVSSNTNLISNITSINKDFTMPAGNITLTATATREEILPNVEVGTFKPTNFPDKNGKTAEPGDVIDYTLTLVNKDDTNQTVNASLNSNGDINQSYEITYYDENNNVVKTETVTDLSNIEIPANGKATIKFSATVSNDHAIGSDVTTGVSVKTTTGKEITKKETSLNIEKSANVISANSKSKNVILILDLSGSMNDNGKIASLRKAASSFATKLESQAKLTNSKISLTLIGIGNGQGYDRTVSEKMADSTYAYKMGSYTLDNWSNVNKKIQSLTANGGTNITGALTIAKGIISNPDVEECHWSMFEGKVCNSTPYRELYDVNYYTSNAETYTVLLTDGANGPSGNIRIIGNEEQVKYVRNNSSMFAIGFGDGAKKGTDGYNDLLAITKDSKLIYSASADEELNKAFDSIATKIGNQQSISGNIEISLPENGKFYPITFSYIDGNIEKILFVINKESELADYNVTLSDDKKKLIWNISGTKYSNYNGLQVKLDLSTNATDGK